MSVSFEVVHMLDYSQKWTKFKRYMHLKITVFRPIHTICVVENLGVENIGFLWSNSRLCELLNTNNLKYFYCEL